MYLYIYKYMYINMYTYICTYVYTYIRIYVSFVSGSLQEYVEIAGKKVDQAEDLKAWLDTAGTN